MNFATNHPIRRVGAALLLVVMASGCQGPTGSAQHGESDNPRQTAEASRSTTAATHSAAILASDQIRSVLRTQADCWNRADLECFMKYYWHSDDLTFSSGGETQRGWRSTMERFRRRYPTAENMGQLAFGDLKVQMLGEAAALVLGTWNLERSESAGGRIGGNFSLVLRRLANEWRIVHDHTSRLEAD